MRSGQRLVVLVIPRGRNTLFAHEVPIILFTDMFDNITQQVKTSVAVLPGLARGELARLRRDVPNELLLSQMPSEFKAGQARVAFEAGSMGQEMPQRDIAPGGRGGLQILSDFIVHREFAILSQQKDARRGELLGNRTNFKNRPGPDRNAQFQLACP